MSGARVLRDYGIAGSFLVLFAVLAVTSGTFLTSTNLLNILDQNAAILIIAAAGTLVIVSGGLDLSVGAAYALCGVLGAKVANSAGPAAGMAVGLTAGLVIGTVNGLLAAYGRINALICTLATSFVLAGIAVVVTGGQLVIVDDPAWQTVGTGTIGDVTYPILIMVVFVALCAFLLSRTVFGRHLFAAGDSRESAWLSGVRVNRTTIVVFALSGLAAGLAGVLDASRVGSGQIDPGMTLLFTVLAAIVIGGTSINGGSGAVWRTCVGVLFLALIGNGFNLLGLNTVYQQIVQGVLIVLAVGVDTWSSARR